MHENENLISVYVVPHYTGTIVLMDRHNGCGEDIDFFRTPYDIYTVWGRHGFDGNRRSMNCVPWNRPGHVKRPEKI